MVDRTANIGSIEGGSTLAKLRDMADGTYAQVIASRNDVMAASGTISTQNLVAAGVATALSAVEIALLGAATLAVQTVGTYTGALSLQVTLDGVVWVTVGGTPLLNQATGTSLASITSALQSTFLADVRGALKARITALAAVTGSVVVTLRAA